MPQSFRPSERFGRLAVAMGAVTQPAGLTAVVRNLKACP
jgi:hypothetical protein